MQWTTHTNDRRTASHYYRMHLFQSWHSGRFRSAAQFVRQQHRVVFVRSSTGAVELRSLRRLFPGSTVHEQPFQVVDFLLTACWEDNPFDGLLGLPPRVPRLPGKELPHLICCVVWCDQFAAVYRSITPPSHLFELTVLYSRRIVVW